MTKVEPAQRPESTEGTFEGTSSTPGGDDYVFVPIPDIAEKCALIRLLRQPIAAALVDPKSYFKASNELVVIALSVCWVVSFAYDPDIVIQHPARNFTGNYNPCFGWDFPPASYIAIFACAADVYLAWRYAELESIRTRLLDRDGISTWAERFAVGTAYLHGLAACLWLLLWSVGPPDGRWGTHLALFSVAVLFRYLCTLGNYVESRFGAHSQRELVQAKHTAFIVAYGLVTVLLPSLYTVDFVVYSRRHPNAGVFDPFLPPEILTVFDLTWVSCLVMSTRLSVPEPPLLISRRVLRFGEEFRVSEEEKHLMDAYRGVVLQEE